MTQTFLQLPDHAGCLYVEFLSRLHTYLKPKTYFEIGTLNGHTLALSKCDSIAVDPSFRLEVDIATGKSVCLLFQMTSDDFFAKYNPQVLLRSTIDMAFLDGMHWFEF